MELPTLQLDNLSKDSAVCRELARVVNSVIHEFSLDSKHMRYAYDNLITAARNFEELERGN